MKITYLGTGAAEGVPAVYCNCETCRAARAMKGREIRTRTQVLIDDVLSVDYPPDAYAHSLRFGTDLSAISDLLVTHTHMDHFYAHDFVLRGYRYACAMTQPALRIYGNDEVRKVMAECTRREMREDVRAGIEIALAEPYRPFRAGAYDVTPFPAVHTRDEISLLYLIERDGKAYLHLHDTGLPPEGMFLYLKENGKRVSLVSLDCTFLDRAPSSGRHMGLRENGMVADRLRHDGVAGGDTAFVIPHFSHNSDPLSGRAERLAAERGFVAAYDGMTLEI